jgi:hypothetical protein
VRVLETRRRVDGSLRRRRRCLACGHRWTTAEDAGGAGYAGPSGPHPIREVVVRIPVPVLPSGDGGVPWEVVESAASCGAPVFVEYDPERRLWLCALTDELNPAEGETAAAAIYGAEAGLRRLLGRAG